MAVEYPLFAQGQLTTSDARLHKPPAGQLWIDAATLCNVTGSAVTVQIGIAKGGGALEDANSLYKSFSISANSTVSLSGLINHHMSTEDELRGLASAGTAITYTLSGRVIT